jgi:hypothetical protein
MELDRTEIIIRKRDSLELMDLSLLVLKRHLVRIAIAGAVYGLPLMVLNILLVNWMISEDAILAAENIGSADTVVLWRYTAHLTILTTMVFPIASFPITLFLGAQIFFLPNTLRDLLGHLRSLSLKMFLILGVFRLGLLAIIVELLIREQYQFEPWEALFLFIAFPICMIIRTFWPFAPEIIGLERCPLRAQEKDQVTYAKRRNSLHGPLQGDLMTRMIAAIIFGALLLLMIVGTALFIKAILSGDWSWNWLFSYLVLPLSLWLVGIFLAVYRYLSYIDSRIRLEGWEIELRLRAEANRLENGEHAIVETGAAAVAASGANP